MVGDDAEGAGGGAIRVIGLAAQLADPGQDVHEGVGLVDALLARQDADGALQAHARVHVLLGQGQEAAVLLLVVLHEDVVPDLQIVAAGTGRGAVGAAGGLVGDDEHLRVRAAGAGDAGRAPPVVLLGEEEEVVLRHAHLPPEAPALVIPGAIGVPGEDREGQPVLVDAQVLRAGEELPGPGDGLPLEVVPQGPVAQHLEEGEVAGVAHIVDVTGADALLHVRQPGAGGMGRTHQVGHQGMHARGGKEHRGVILRDDGGRGDPVVALGLHEGLEFLPQLGGGDVHEHGWLTPSDFRSL